MKDVKIVIIGAGSTVFTPGLLADLVSSPHLNDATVALVDTKPEAVDMMLRLGRRLVAERRVALRIEGTTDRREALAGATFVTTTIAVGGAKGWEQDVRIPERYGVYQTVGDSVGPGGVFRALRHAPEMVRIARDMEELCPDAWLFNYTNPLSANVRAVHKVSPIKCVGLCHGILHTRSLLARDLGIPKEELNVVAAGVNHLAWLLDLRYRGHDVYPQLRELVAARLEWARRGERVVLAASDDPYDAFQQVSAILMEIYGLYPSPGDRHVGEFFGHYLRKQGDELAYGLQGSLDLTNSILWGKDTLWEQLQAQSDGTAPLDPSLLSSAREGERVVKIMESILLDLGTPELAVNVRNDGLIPNLPDFAVVEVPGIISGYGVRGLGVDPLPDGIAGVLRARIYQQELTVDAALNGDRNLALQALLADALVPDLPTAEFMLGDALTVHADYLPQFA